MKFTYYFVYITSGIAFICSALAHPDSRPNWHNLRRAEGHASPTLVDYASFDLSTELKKRNHEKAKAIPSFVECIDCHTWGKAGLSTDVYNASIFPGVPFAARTLFPWLKCSHPPLTTLTLDNIGGHFEYNISSAGSAELHITLWNATEPTTLAISTDATLKVLPKLELIFIMDYSMHDLNLVSGFHFQCPNGTQILFNQFIGDLIYPSNFSQCTITPLPFSNIHGTGYPTTFLNFNLNYNIVIQSSGEIAPAEVFLNTGVDIILVRDHLEINEVSECEVGVQGVVMNQVDVEVNATIGFQTTQRVSDKGYFTSNLEPTTSVFSNCTLTSSATAMTTTGLASPTGTLSSV